MEIFKKQRVQDNRACLVAKSCPTLSNPMNCSLQGSSVHGISQGGILEWTAIPFSRGVFPGLLLGRWILCHWAAWEAQRTRLCSKYTSRYITGPCAWVPSWSSLYYFEPQVKHCHFPLCPQVTYADIFGWALSGSRVEFTWVRVKTPGCRLRSHRISTLQGSWVRVRRTSAPARAGTRQAALPSGGTQAADLRRRSSINVLPLQNAVFWCCC